MRNLFITLLLLAIMGLTGCASVAVAQLRQNNNMHAAIRGGQLDGGGPSLGLSLFDLGGIKTAADLFTQLSAAAVDIVTGILAVKAYKDHTDSTDTAVTTPPTPQPTYNIIGNGNTIITKHGRR